jgi:hypothetical protein
MCRDDPSLQHGVSFLEARLQPRWFHVYLQQVNSVIAESALKQSGVLPTRGQSIHTYYIVDTPGTPGNQAGSCDVAKTAGDRDSRAYRRSGDPFSAWAIEIRSLRRSRGVYD